MRTLSPLLVAASPELCRDVRPELGQEQVLERVVDAELGR
jgi:hypothetical protein